MGRQISFEEQHLRDLLSQIGKLVDLASLTNSGMALVATPLPVAVSVEQAAPSWGLRLPQWTNTSGRGTYGWAEES